ncbi:MAG TPA: hypothetical protein VGP25_20115 [Gemmatimonadaceae bacterium]|jgi:hypothetical protein|nr:hypothetical protein [Gemmatimonadaceae bacterium]
MRRSHLARSIATKLIAAVTLGVALFAFAPTLGNATILGNVWTTRYTGGGYTAVTTSLRPAELRVESDWSSGSWSGWTGDYQYNQTFLSVDGHASPCVNSYSVSTQHSAYEPSTGDYGFATTGGSASC